MFVYFTPKIRLMCAPEAIIRFRATPHSHHAHTKGAHSPTTHTHTHSNLHSGCRSLTSPFCPHLIAKELHSSCHQTTRTLLLFYILYIYIYKTNSLTSRCLCFVRVSTTTTHFPQSTEHPAVNPYIIV